MVISKKKGWALVPITKIRGNLLLTVAVLFVMLRLVPCCYAQEQQAVGAPEAPASGETVEPASETRDLPTVNMNTSFYSQYIWRGYELSQDSLVIFPSVTVSYKGFSLNIWGDIDTDYAGRPDGLQLWEKDYLAWYSNSWKKLNYTVGYIYYETMPAHNQEVWLTFGLDTLLNPTVSVYREIQLSGEGWYCNVAVSHSIAVPKDRVCWEYDWSFDVGGWVGYINQDDFTSADIDYSAWHDGNVWAGLTIPLSDVCSITPKIQYSFPLSNEGKENIKASSFDGNDSQFVYGGLIFDYNF